MTEKQLMDAVVDAAKQLSTLQDALADYCLRTNKESLTVAEPASQWIPVSEQLLDAYAQISKGAERMSNRDCKHGQLARSCNICELEEEVIEKAITIAALEREVERLKKDAARLRPALEETVKSLEIISQQAGESRGLSTFTQIKQYALDWVRTVRKDLAAREAV